MLVLVEGQERETPHDWLEHLRVGDTGVIVVRLAGEHLLDVVWMGDIHHRADEREGRGESIPVAVTAALEEPDWVANESSSLEETRHAWPGGQ